MRFARHAALMLAIVVIDLPVTFVVTFMLVPLWSAIERRWGIESVGHSGPATWCFGAMLTVVVALSLGTYLRAMRRPSRASP